ncbi:MAG: hypothetical protein O2931_15975 [Planctomycetota bacterium]|nr:hypothetical protein [Planctomycetota bacterium]MDA1180279.1 hypothetical protein [Planctomycetota bacterium]
MIGEPLGPDKSEATSSPPSVNGKPNWPLSPLLRAIGLLLLAVGCPAVLWSWFEFTANDWVGMWSVVVPAVSCASAGVAALLLTALSGVQRSLGPLLGSIIARTMFPMAVCLALVTSQPQLAQQGLLWKFLAFYLLALTAETLLATVLLKKYQHRGTRIAANPHHGYR